MNASTGKIGIITGIRCVEIPDFPNYYVLEDGRENGEAHSISVAKIDKQTNEILEIYPSIRTAASASNIKATNIGQFAPRNHTILQQVVTSGPIQRRWL